ncbi:MAG: alpha/beta hydrolase family protein [Leptospiraceae bacterium]|nr:alpha/beta hydrolase family protein [Leptospiraceae bacterium]
MLDEIYFRLLSGSDFFRGGWGDYRLVDYLIRAGNDRHALPERVRTFWERNAIGPVDFKFDSDHRTGNVRIQTAAFPTAFRFPVEDAELSRRRLPAESAMARLEWIQPLDNNVGTPVVVHFAATGDEGFGRRRNMYALSLARMGIASIILELPLYGSRRPAGQQGANLRYFSDLIYLSLGAQCEGIAITRTLAALGYTNILLTGVSMGGYLAVATAALCPDVDPQVVSLIPSHSAAPVYTEGLIRRACDWNALGHEIEANLPDHVQQHVSPSESARILVRRLFATSDIRYLPPPRSAARALIIAGRADRYIPSYSPQIIHRHWSGSELRLLRTGHVGTFLFYRRPYLRAILEKIGSRYVA